VKTWVAQAQALKVYSKTKPNNELKNG